MAGPEQKCGECDWFKLGRSQSNLRFSTVAGALELLKSGPGQLLSNTGVCEAPYQTFNGRKQDAGFVVFTSQQCGARDGNQQLLFQPKK